MECDHCLYSFWVATSWLDAIDNFPQGDAIARCARMALPWALMGPSRRDSKAHR